MPLTSPFFPLPWAVDIADAADATRERCQRETTVRKYGILTHVSEAGSLLLCARVRVIIYPEPQRRRRGGICPTFSWFNKIDPSVVRPHTRPFSPRFPTVEHVVPSYSVFCLTLAWKRSGCRSTVLFAFLGAPSPFFFFLFSQYEVDHKICCSSTASQFLLAKDIWLSDRKRQHRKKKHDESHTRIPRKCYFFYSPATALPQPPLNSNRLPVFLSVAAVLEIHLFYSNFSSSELYSHTLDGGILLPRRADLVTVRAKQEQE